MNPKVESFLVCTLCGLAYGVLLQNAASYFVGHPLSVWTVASAGAAIGAAIGIYHGLNRR